MMERNGKVQTSDVEIERPPDRGAIHPDKGAPRGSLTELPSGAMCQVITVSVHYVDNLIR